MSTFDEWRASPHKDSSPVSRCAGCKRSFDEASLVTVKTEAKGRIELCKECVEGFEAGMLEA